jgi:hypothetical protein
MEARQELTNALTPSLIPEYEAGEVPEETRSIARHRHLPGSGR